MTECTFCHANAIYSTHRLIRIDGLPAIRCYEYCRDHATLRDSYDFTSAEAALIALITYQLCKTPMT